MTCVCNKCLVDCRLFGLNGEDDVQVEHEMCGGRKWMDDSRSDKNPPISDFFMSHMRVFM